MSLNQAKCLGFWFGRWGFRWGAGGSAGGISLARAKRARTGFEGGIGGGMAGIILGVPQHASLFSPVADVPSPTNSVPIFSLDEGEG